MDTKKLLKLKSHLHFLDTRFLSEFLYSTMFRFGSFLWVSLWSFMVNLFGSISKYMQRLKADHGDHQGGDTNFGATCAAEGDQVVYKSCSDSKSDDFGETEEDAHGGAVKTEDSVIIQSGLNSCEKKYQFLSNRDVRGFMEGPKMFSFKVEEMFVDSIEGWMSNSQTLDHDGVVMDNEFLMPNSEKNGGGDEDLNHSSDIDDHDHKLDSWSSMDEGLQQHKAEIDALEQQKAEDSVESVCIERNLEEHNEATWAECEILEDNERDIWEKSMENKNNSCDYVLLEDQGSDSELKPDSGSSCDFDLANYQAEIIGSYECCSDEHVDEILLSETSTNSDQILPEKTERNADVDEVDASNLSSVDDGQENFIIYSKEDYADDEYIELDPHLQNSEDHHGKNSSSKDVSKVEDLQELEMDGLRKLEEQSSDKKSWDSDSDEEDELDILQEHRHLVQQMKMEMRYSRVKGLPTISEECETPKTVEDLKPLRIDEKFEYKDRMEEIQKFYRSYSEKMRKLDILNYQTIHAISFLQLKDSEVFMAGQKSSISLIKPFIPKFWPYKLRRIYADSTHKSIIETHRDLELVYVGQICLSWEILQWQYAKAKELLEYDPQGCHSYNKAAAEYQQFQVLVERFVEDEPFQGPRVQHYVKNRCIVRSLAQIPMIKDDCLKDKKDRGEEEEEEDVISVAVLAKIIKESMQVFWEFLSTEKGETKMASKAGQGTQVDLQDPADARLLMDIRTSLQQKERRLKDILRSRNCIVKKFQKYQRGGENHALFFSQVELKLVSRVLNLSRVTIDQLMWCERKLNNISFLGRKVHVEPSFCLFPC